MHDAVVKAKLRELHLDAKDVWTQHPVVDWIICGLVGAALAALAVWDRIDVDPLGDAGVEARAKAYSAFAIVVSILAAFTTATTTAYVSSDGARQKQMRQIFGEDVRRSLQRAITTSVLVVLVMMIGLVVDTAGVRFEEWRFILFPLVLLGLLRFGRVAYLFSTRVALKVADARDPVRTVDVAPFDPAK